MNPRTNGAHVDVQTTSGPQGEGSTQPPVLHTYRRPQWVLARFVARRTARSAILWGAVFGLYVYAQTVGFTDLAPTPAGRQQFLAPLAGSTGLQALFGVPYRIDTVGGFVTVHVICNLGPSRSPVRTAEMEWDRPTISW